MITATLTGRLCKRPTSANGEARALCTVVAGGGASPLVVLLVARGQLAEKLRRATAGDRVRAAGELQLPRVRLDDHNASIFFDMKLLEFERLDGRSELPPAA